VIPAPRAILPKEPGYVRRDLIVIKNTINGIV
jgi:hypothetical protein